MRMKTTRLLLAALAVCTSVALNAQIFINTGNPNMNKYRNDNPNAVIWENGKTPEDPKKEPVANTSAPEKQEAAKSAEEKTTKVETSKTEPAKTAAATTPVKTTTAGTAPASTPAKTT